VDGTSGAVSSMYVRAEMLDAALKGAAGFGQSSPGESDPFGGLTHRRAAHRRFSDDGECPIRDRRCPVESGWGQSIG
jgi:hypothetical protein